jgi:deoxyribonuclease-4
MKQIGLKLWSINEDYVDEALKLYAEGYFNYIELYVVPHSYQKHISLWRNLREKHQIPFIVHAPHFANGFNLAKKEYFNSNVNMYQEVKRFADSLAVEFIIFHGGVDGDIEETARQLKSLDESRALIENKPYKALPNNMGANICRG